MGYQMYRESVVVDLDARVRRRRRVDLDAAQRRAVNEVVVDPNDGIGVIELNAAAAHVADE